MATVTKNQDSILLGLGQLRLGLSSSYITDTTAVLTDTNYIGSQAEIGFTADRSIITEFVNSGGVLVPNDSIAIRASFSLQIAMYEVTESNLSFVLGGSGISTNIINDLIGSPTKLRAEVIFTFPNKVNTITIILPKAVSIGSVNLDCKDEDAATIPLELTALYTDDSNWTSNPYGKFIFN